MDKASCSCSVADCDRPSRALTYCTMHHRRWERHGNTDGRAHWTVRFWESVDKTGECWLWMRSINRGGYGHFRHMLPSGSKTTLAHRAAYEITEGPIPDGMFIDHVCHNRACVNPEHLRLASNKQNMENRIGAQANGSSGVRGVTAGTKPGTWVVRIGHHGRVIHVGTYSTLAEADAASTAKRLELFTHSDSSARNR